MIMNKHGWSLKEMLLLSGILILFLFVAIYYILVFYQNVDDPGVSYYEKMENTLLDRATLYLNQYYDNDLDRDGIIITMAMLEEYDLDVDLVDQEGSVCSGYVLANKTRGEESIEAYINCGEYTTDGFDGDML